MNKMVQDIDQVTDRDMYLVREATRNIRQLMDDADKKMAEFSEASGRLRSMIAESDKIKKSQTNYQDSKLYQDQNQTPVRRKSLTNPQINAYLKNTKAAQKMNPETSFEVNPNMQGDLFNSERTDSVLKDETIITTDGAALKEVPLIITEVYEDKPVTDAEGYENPENNYPVYENAIEPHNEPLSLQEKVIRMYKQGYKNDEIALALSCSRTEVDFIIDME